MAVLRGGGDTEFHVADASQPGHLKRCALVVHAAKFPQAGVGCEQITILAHKFWEVKASDFFLAFDDEFDVAGELAFCFQEGIDGRQPAEDMALIVAHAAGKHLALADSGFKGWGGPKLEGLGRLNIIMVVEEQRPVALAFALGEDDRLPMC